MKKDKFELTIAWLYPDLMSTYGDRGNVLVLQKRLEWHGINAKVLRVEQNTSVEEIAKVDLIFAGGAQDRQQSIVMKDLKTQKGEIIKQLIDKGVPALFVCGAPQLMGKYYEPGIGQRIEGLGIFDMYSVHPGLNKPRLIGNIVAKVSSSLSFDSAQGDNNSIIVGFENHGGRTYLGKNVKPFAKVIKGFGNNGEDGTEGVVYKNAIGCYFHGPLLPKNPKIADYLISTALLQKYKKKIKLSKLDDGLENLAKQAVLNKIGVKNRL